MIGLPCEAARYNSEPRMTDLPTLDFRLPWALKFEGDRLEDCDTLSPDAPHDIVIGRTRDDVTGFATFLGKVAEAGQFDKKLWLDLRGAHAVYIMGKRRAGKTHSLAVICEGLASKSWTTDMAQRQAVLVFDTMNVFLTATRPASTAPSTSSDSEDWELPAETPNVQLWRPASTPGIEGQAVPEVSLGGHDLTAEEWISTFGVDQFADVLGHLIFDAYERVRYSGYTTAQGSVSPKDRFGLADLERCVATARELADFRDETRQAAVRRFRALAQNSIFSTDGLDLAKLLVPGRVSVLLLRDLPSETRELLVSVLVRRIMESRSETERYERLLTVSHGEPDKTTAMWKEKAANGTPRCWIVIDEAHNYIPNSGPAISKRPLKKLIDEGRNLGISIVAATQQPSGLDSSIRRNADVLMIHPMSMEDDIRVASSMLTNPWPRNSHVMKSGAVKGADFFDAVRSLPRGYALISSETLPRITAVRIRPRLTDSGDKGY
jgi:hypothetical protein